jgi:cell division protein FtsI (penicillin-binding protein 3)
MDIDHGASDPAPAGEDRAETGYFASELRLDGQRKLAAHQARSRIVMAMAAVVLAYGVIAGRLAWFGFQEPGALPPPGPADQAITARRPDLLDRNGLILATDINTASLYAEPRRVFDADDTVERLRKVLPDLHAGDTWNKLKSKAGFVWLKRELTPVQQTKILSLGIPGIGFRQETRRFYPKGETASHIVGHVNIDNDGIAGIEKYLDDRGLRDLRRSGLGGGKAPEPVRLSIDLRVQHFVRDALEKGMDRYRAVAAGGVVLDVETGEILAMASLPDYDPNRPVDALKKDRLNRMSAGTFEMGSTFKVFTTAMALDSGKVGMKDTFDATRAIQIGGHRIEDFHGKKRVLSVPEVFIYSSNIGAAKMADAVGIEGHREFLHRIGLLDRMAFELPEIAAPSEPAEWKKIHSVTIAFGHGVTTTPLQTAVAAAALMNGGLLIPPTLLPRSREQAAALARVVVQPQTSAAMRHLMRLNVEEGSGRQAEVEGYRVGGKTGTAEKVVRGRYSAEKRFNAFLAAFPIDAPRYVVLVVIDEPKPEKDGGGATAGANAAVMVGDIIRRSAPLLGVEPAFDAPGAPVLVSR